MHVQRETYVHHLWIPLSIAAIEEVEHFFLELFAVLVDVFSSLSSLSNRVQQRLRVSPCLRWASRLLSRPLSVGEG